MPPREATVRKSLRISAKMDARAEYERQSMCLATDAAIWEIAMGWFLDFRAQCRGQVPVLVPAELRGRAAGPPPRTSRKRAQLGRPTTSHRA